MQSAWVEKVTQLFVLNLLVVACSASEVVRTPADAFSDQPLQPVEVAEALIDAFYSFDADRLAPFLKKAPGSAAALNFYQGWAAGGNYKVLERRPCEADSASVVMCAITVEDDAVLALNIGFNVTDTFKVTFDGASIVAVENSSNDKPIYYEAYNWVAETMPDVMTGPCQGFFNGGPTPGDCARAMTAGYRKFAASRN